MVSSEAAHLETFGFVVLRGLVAPAPLAREFDATMLRAFRRSDREHSNSGAAGNRFRYVPMMCERTPVSLGLIHELSSVAAALLGAPVLPVRAKATNYLGSTGWHRDTDLPVRSLGLACYLDDLEAASGALRVLPGSHRPEFGAAVDGYLHGGADVPDVPGVALPTAPGDAIVFDEHLYHASSGGRSRRQWRIDFVADDGDDAVLGQYYRGQYAPGWDGGYDVDRYPSYGHDWRALDRRWDARLEELGAYAAAAAEEDGVRATRRA